MAAGHAEVEQEIGLCQKCDSRRELIQTPYGYFVEPHFDSDNEYCDGGLLPPRAASD